MENNSHIPELVQSLYTHDTVWYKYIFEIGVCIKKTAIEDTK